MAHADNPHDGSYDVDAHGVAVQAYIWGLPLVMAAKGRLTLTNPADPWVRRPPTSAGAPLNNIGHARDLADPTFNVGPGPNVDTLYTLPRLDLADEPFVLETPDFGSRYYTFQMAYADSSADVSLGQRTHGGQLPPVFMHGPTYRGEVPQDMVVVASHTRYLHVQGRILVQPDDPEDFTAVHALQDRITLRTYSAYLEGRTGPNPVPDQRPLTDPTNRVDAGLVFLEELGNVLRDWVVRADERPLVASLRRIGLTTDGGFRPQDLSERDRLEMERGLIDGQQIVTRKSLDLGVNVNGWTINYSGPRFGTDYLLRAGVAKDQIFVTIPEEALFPVARVDGIGQPLHGSHAYRIIFPAYALPPVDGFWSITMYDDRGFLVANPLGRYAIGDRTPGLVRNADGSLEIRIQHAPPSARETNWLPGDAGPFYVMMRLYVPRPEALDGSWKPPPLERVEPA